MYLAFRLLPSGPLALQLVHAAVKTGFKKVNPGYYNPVGDTINTAQWKPGLTIHVQRWVSITGSVAKNPQKLSRSAVATAKYYQRPKQLCNVPFF